MVKVTERTASVARCELALGEKSSHQATLVCKYRILHFKGVHLRQHRGGVRRAADVREGNLSEIETSLY